MQFLSRARNSFVDGVQGNESVIKQELQLSKGDNEVLCTNNQNRLHTTASKYRSNKKVTLLLILKLFRTCLPLAGILGMTVICSSLQSSNQGLQEYDHTNQREAQGDSDGDVEPEESVTVKQTEKHQRRAKISLERNNQAVDDMKKNEIDHENTLLRTT